MENSNQCGAPISGSHSPVKANLDKSKQPLKEDVRVDISGPSVPLTDQDSSPYGELLTRNIGRFNNPTNLFSQDDGQRSNYLTVGIPLYQAAMKGDWSSAERIINDQKDNNIVAAAITNKLETALHIAVAAKHKGFVRNLLRRMDPSDLALQNVDGNTALCFAAASGVTEIAEMMIKMNSSLPMIRGGGKLTPINMAAMFGHRKMVIYLYDKTKFKDRDVADIRRLFLAIIAAGIYDVALTMLKDIKFENQELALSRNGIGETALHMMARKPYAIAQGKQLNLFQRLANSTFKGFFHEAKMRICAHHLVEELWKVIVKLPVKKVYEILRSPSRLLFDAAQSGNVELLVILFRSYPDLLWKVDDKNRSLFHTAAINRHENIFNIIYELGTFKDLLAAYREEESENNLLHLVACLPPISRLQVVSGAALQMQRELLWFKAVKKIVPRSYIKAKNKKGEVAHDLFTESHKNLRKEGEQWMKETATSCMLVATLIATVVFAAAFTVPGSNDAKGFANFRKKLWFDIFILSDSVALFSSVTSIVIFLSILTSRYAERDFRTALPLKLMLGLLALFVSIISMVLAFTAAMILIHYQEPKYSLVLIVCLASLTALSFVGFHIHLWFDTLCSCLFGFLFHRRKTGLYPPQVFNWAH